MATTFGKRLNAFRKAKRITAQAMADQLGIGLRTYRNYESDSRRPSLDTVVQIANILGVSTDYLLRDD